MNIALWIVQILLALAFAAAGILKTTQSISRLQKSLSWTKHVSPAIVRLVGALEVLGALGLILPIATKILPWLTPVAAIGLVITMIGAIIVHLRLNEAKQIAVPLILLLLSAFVAVGYFIWVPVM